MATVNGIKIKWSKRERDLMVYYDNPGSAHFINDTWLTPEIKKELSARGFDLTTLKIEIKRKPGHVPGVGPYENR